MSSGSPDELFLSSLRFELGPAYGSEDLCVLLYAIVRSRQYRRIVELGSGLGVTTAWIAKALAERSSGTIWTIDDGRDFGHYDLELLEGFSSQLTPLSGVTTHQEFLERVFQLAGVDEHVDARCASLDLADPVSVSDLISPFREESIDMVFSDFAHGPDNIFDVLSVFLPLLARHSSIFFDSASTHLPAYLALEKTVDQMNRNKVPDGLQSRTCEKQKAEIRDIIATTDFQLVHLIEAQERRQNSTAWIRIMPVDYYPGAAAFMH